MGKPIAGRNKPPFGIDGINVDAAVLTDGTQFTDIRISKQRSDVMFDLMSTDGADLYQFVLLTGVDKNGLPLDINDDNSTLATKLAKGHFCISIVDENDQIVGFAIRLLLNKVILQDGTSFFLNDYSGQSGNPIPHIPVSGVTVLPGTFNITVGSTQQLQSTIEPPDATNKNINWSSSIESVASVNSTGLVTALTNGTSVITATTVDGSFKDTSIATVTTLATGVTISPTTFTIEIGDTQQLTANVLPTTASNKSVTWSSGSPTVASVNSTGLVTALTNGTSVITATTVDGSHTNTSICTVDTAVQSVSVTPESLSLNVGATSQLSATVLPVNAENKTVNWSSDHASIASVNSTGLVSAVSNGVAVITATTVDGSHTDTSTVTVSTPVSSVVMTPEIFTVSVGETQQLTANVLPATASNKSVTWLSGTPSVATVSSTGLVTGVSNGSSIISVITVDGSHTDTSECTVITGVQSVSVAPPTITVNTGSTAQLTATVLPVDATNKNVVWSSDTLAVATVNNTGLITGVSNGTAIIKATTVDGSFESTSTATVRTAVTSVTLNKSTSTLELEQTEQLSATVLPSTASNKNVTWSANNANATVSSTGLVTGISIGSCTITATTVDGSHTATCVYTIKAKTIHPSSVTLDQTSVTIPAGLNLRVTATVLPENAANKNLVWASSNEQICTVSVGGINNIATITGVSNGTTQVTATTVDGGIVATCDVTIVTYIPVQSLTVDKPTLALVVGQSQTVNAIITPSNSNTIIRWNNSYPQYYTVQVSSDGKSAVFTGVAAVANNSPFVVTAGSTNTGDNKVAAVSVTVSNT